MVASALAEPSLGACPTAPAAPITKAAEAAICAAIEALGNASSVTSEPSPRRVIRAHNSPFFA